MLTPKKHQVLRRYTKLSVLIDMLVNKRLTLISPSRWDDINDADMIERYKKCHDIKFVGALCLTASAETYHHWKIFADGVDGVCIEFNYDELQRYLSPNSSIRIKPVQYVTLANAGNNKLYPLSDMPFYKRNAFRAEEEVRIIFETSEDISLKHIPIDLTCIRRIVANPFLPENLLSSVRRIINSIQDCTTINVDKSRLMTSKGWSVEWEKYVDRAKHDYRD